MRNIWRIFCDDLRDARSSIVSALVVLSLCLVPVVCAWVSIAANWDPFSNTGQLKVAVANEDEGYESSLMPVRLNIGERVVNTLRDNDAYNWTFVGEREAMEGVRSGEYYAAIVLPKDFSSKIMSVLSSDIGQTNISFFLNMKENPSASVIAAEGASGAEEGIRETFTKAVDEMTLGLASDLVSFAGGDNAREFGARLVAHLDSSADDLDSLAEQLRAYSSILGATSSLTSAAAQTLTGAEKVSDASESALDVASEGLDAAISSAQSAASDVDQQVKSSRNVGGLAEAGTDVASGLSDSVESLAKSVNSVSREADSLVQTMQDVVKKLAGAGNSVATDLGSIRNDLGVSANKLNAAASKIRKFQDDAAAAIARGDLTEMATIVGGSEASLAKWLADPIEIDKQVLYPIENFGSSKAPFYTVLSLWIGIVALMAMLKIGLSRERLSGYEEQQDQPVRNYEQYLGRYLIFVLLALVQATFVGLGELLFLHIQCSNPLLFMVACWVCAIVFSSIVYALVVSFGGIGMALCVVMLVIQLAGMGGEFPMQMMPGFYQAVSLISPLMYATHSLQASVAGVYGVEFAFDLLCMAAFLVAAFAFGLALRRPLIRAGNYFESKLSEADFI